jgi:hypothetical protein
MTEKDSWFSIGLVSTVLGSIGMLLFFLPILGTPLSAIGLVAALAGVTGAWADREISLRWSVAGLLICGAALTANLGMAFGPIDLVPRYPVAPMWQPVPDRPYVPPPALPQEIFAPRWN